MPSPIYRAMKPSYRANYLAGASLVGANDFAQVFGIKLVSEHSRVDQIAEHDG